MCETTGGEVGWRRMIQTERREDGESGNKARHREREIERVWETNEEKRSSVQECVRKRDGGNIYLSPDGSVLGVHLWRNEISG